MKWVGRAGLASTMDSVGTLAGAPARARLLAETAMRKHRKPREGWRRIDHEADPFRCGDCILVLPDTHDKPSRRSKGRIVSAITGNISLKLCLPVRTVRSWGPAVFGAGMPEAAVEEHRDACGWKDDVGSAAQRLNRHRMLPEAQPHPVKLRPERDLWPSVRRTVAAHDGACRERAWLRRRGQPHWQAGRAERGRTVGRTVGAVRDPYVK